MVKRLSFLLQTVNEQLLKKSLKFIFQIFCGPKELEKLTTDQSLLAVSFASMSL
ncbi:hypothetical protein DPMN_090279 [Dreissena polymorpha]|uniref:Uncharacterized protein n=1 Tax=Dreissena polymorpha TaxID=45954 RepID=A0A9D4KXF0_DREPO|nr:hypothetical protein DPMN_090279 [Dreissena polymorpha]